MTTVRDRRRRRRRDRIGQFLVILCAVLAGFVAAWLGKPVGEGGAAPNVEVGAERDAELRSSDAEAVAARTLLVGHRDADGTVDLLVASGWDTGLETGTTVLIPTGTLVEVPSLGTRRIADVARLGDEAALETSVENALGATFDGLVLLDDAQLAAALGPAGPFTAEFRRAVRVDDDAGTFGFREGEQTVEPAEAARLLAALPERGELEHLVAVRAVVEGWRGALQDETVATATTGAHAPLLPFVLGAAADMRYELLPVKSVATGAGEHYQLQRDEADAVVRAAFPWAVVADGSRPRVEILNGTGAIGLTQAVASELVPAGAWITLTGNVPGFGVTTTEVVYYDDSAHADARRLAEILGAGPPRRATESSGVVDITVVVGADFESAAPTSAGT